MCRLHSTSHPEVQHTQRTHTHTHTHVGLVAGLRFLTVEMMRPRLMPVLVFCCLCVRGRRRRLCSKCGENRPGRSQHSDWRDSDPDCRGEPRARPQTAACRALASVLPKFHSPPRGHGHGVLCLSRLRLASIRRASSPLGRATAYPVLQLIAVRPYVCRVKKSRPLLPILEARQACSKKSVTQTPK